jgi:nucleoside triphosphate pyrophosphatase
VRLVLASASPRRAELLRAAGFTFETLVVEIDETQRPGEEPAAYVRRLAMEKSAGASAALHGPAKAGHYVRRAAETGHDVRGAAETGQHVRGGAEAGHHVRGDMASDGSHSDRSYVVSGFSRTIGDDEPVILGADTTVVVDGEILGKPRDEDDAARMLRRLSGGRHHVLTGVSLRRHAIEAGRVETTAVDFMALNDADVAWYVASGEGRDKAGGYAIQGLASRFITRIEGSYSNVVGLPVHTVLALLRELQ